MNKVSLQSPNCLGRRESDGWLKESRKKIMPEDTLIEIDASAAYAIMQREA